MDEHLDCGAFRGNATERSSMELLWQVADLIPPIDCRRSPQDLGKVVSLAHFSREIGLPGLTETLQNFRWTNTVSESRDQLYKLIGLPEIEQFKALYITRVHLPSSLAQCPLERQVRFRSSGQCREFALVFPVMAADWRMFPLYQDLEHRRLTWVAPAGIDS